MAAVFDSNVERVREPGVVAVVTATHQNQTHVREVGTVLGRRGKTGRCRQVGLDL